MNNLARLRHRYCETGPDHLHLIVETLSPWNLIRSMKYCKDTKTILAVFDKKAAEKHFDAVMAALSDGFDVEWDDRDSSVQGGVMEDRRQFSRIPLSARTVVRFNDWTVDSRACDISLMGVSIVSDPGKPMQLGRKCNLAVHLDTSEVVLEFEAEVIHLSPETTRFRFLNSDIDSFIHLRQMLEFNRVEPEQLQIELTAFIEAARETFART